MQGTALTKDAAAALELYQETAGAGEVEAQLALGELLLEGKDVEKSPGEGLGSHPGITNLQIYIYPMGQVPLRRVPLRWVPLRWVPLRRVPRRQVPRQRTVRHSVHPAAAM